MPNANILLAGQGVDLIGNMAQGFNLGTQAREARRQNALADLYRTQGAGIVQGDQGALNALAGFDPAAALGIMDARQAMDARSLNMDQTRQQMAALSAQERREAEQMAANLDAAQREQAAAQLESVLKGAAYFHAQGDQAGYDAYMRSNGVDPADGEYAFGNFPAMAARTGGVLEVLRGFQPEAGGQERYRAVGGNVWDWTPEGGGAPVALSSGGQEEVIFGPDGQPILSRGPVGSTARLTEAQGKDNVYATRAEGALAVLDPVAGELVSRTGAVLDTIPLGIGREGQSDNYQLAKQAGLDFLVAILRKDTGAAVAPSEEEIYGRIFLPQPGDGDAVVEQKRQARARAVEALKSGMSPSQILQVGQALMQSEARAGAPAPAASVTAQSVATMPADQLAEYMTNTPVEDIPDDVLQAIIARGN